MFRSVRSCMSRSHGALELRLLMYQEAIARIKTGSGQRLTWVAEVLAQHVFVTARMSGGSTTKGQAVPGTTRSKRQIGRGCSATFAFP